MKSHLVYTAFIQQAHNPAQAWLWKHAYWNYESFNFDFTRCAKCPVVSMHNSLNRRQKHILLEQ